VKSWWRDGRTVRWVAQFAALLLIVLMAWILWGNLSRNLAQRGLQLGFNFLNSQAGFAIAETPIPYDPQDSYLRVLTIGLLNALKVVGWGILLATGVGISVGVARLSNNWLIRKLTLVYVEVFRNTPLLLQLLFWYFAVFLQLPDANTPYTFLGFIVLSNQGVTLPGNTQLSPEFSALLVGLTLYTGAFIAEIVRGGIQGVPKGQWEAAKALGLKPNLTMRWVIFPQALRIMIPQLTSQYLNLAKNSSLAIAVGYPDIYATASTTFNQTGRAVEVMVLLMSTYLVMSLLISLVMNCWNQYLLRHAG
jgi:general L-amino acid transport system permease protein